MNVADPAVPGITTLPSQDEVMSQLALAADPETLPGERELIRSTLISWCINTGFRPLIAELFDQVVRRNPAELVQHFPAFALACATPVEGEDDTATPPFVEVDWRLATYASDETGV
jgi:hypothetical protein